MPGVQASFLEAPSFEEALTEALRSHPPCKVDLRAARRLPSVDQQQDDQRGLHNLIDIADRILPESHDKEIHNERHDGKDDQQPTDNIPVLLQRWQVERSEEHKVTYPIEKEER